MGRQESQSELIDHLKRIPIEDIYGRYVGGQLKRRGSKAVAHCPWHGSDSSPSLTLYTQKNNWYCYGCHQGGTTIDLVMAALGLAFPEAVAAAAADYGLSAGAPLPPEKKRQLMEAREKSNIKSGFTADFDRVFSYLVSRKWELADKLKTYNDYARNIDLVRELSILDGVMDEMIDARSDSEKLEAWRMARRVFPWIKTKTSATS